MRAKDKEVNPPLLLPCSRFCPPPLLSLSPSLLFLAPFLSLPYLSLSSPSFLLVVPLYFHFSEVSLGLHRRGKAEEKRQGKEGERKKRERGERESGGERERER